MKLRAASRYLAGTRLRLAGAALLLVVGVWSLLDVQGLYGGGPEAARRAAALAFVALLALAAAAVLLAYDLVDTLAGRFVAGLFPTWRLRVAAPAYRRIHRLERRGDHAGAMEEYERLVHERPGDLALYLDMVEIAFLALGDPARARAITERGTANLPREQDRDLLEHRYRTLAAGQRGPDR